MSWNKKKVNKNKSASIIKKLRKEGKINEEFEVMLSSLTLEELISLKLELAIRSVGGLLYGLPLWYTLPAIIKESVYNFAISATNTKKEASNFLGISQTYLNNLEEQYNIDK